MPPKVKITKEDIIQTALDLLRKEGEGAVNARAIATALDCSTQPIFSNFTTMEELQSAVKNTAHALYLDFLQREAEEGKYPQYKAYGMAYIRFAKEEKELFRTLFMCDRSGESPAPTADFTTSIELIMKSNNVTKERAELMHMEMWACVHGVATMHATSFLLLDEAVVSRMLTDIYQGIRATLVSEGMK